MFTTIFNLANAVSVAVGIFSDFMLNDWLYRNLFVIGDFTITPISLIFGYGLTLFVQIYLGKIILKLLV